MEPVTQKRKMVVTKLYIEDGRAVTVARFVDDTNPDSIIFTTDKMFAPRIGRGITVTIEYES